MQTFAVPLLPSTFLERREDEKLDKFVVCSVKEGPKFVAAGNRSIGLCALKQTVSCTSMTTRKNIIIQLPKPLGGACTKLRVVS
jgi:hypothetical protein